MTEPCRRLLWTPEGFRDDVWQQAGTADECGGSGNTIYTLDGLSRGIAEDRLDEGGRSGVLLQPDEPVESVVPWLARLALVALAFPVFADGRSFSKAGLLRGRYGYAGTIRATGDVLIDQIPLMIRVGFSEFVVSNPATLARLEARGLDLPRLYYQPAAGPVERAGRYAWRRLPAA